MTSVPEGTAADSQGWTDCSPCPSHLGQLIFHVAHKPGTTGTSETCRIEQTPTPRPTGLGTPSGEGEERERRRAWPLGKENGAQAALCWPRGHLQVPAQRLCCALAVLPHPQPGYLLGRAMSPAQPKPGERSTRRERAKPFFAEEEGYRTPLWGLCLCG